MPKEPNPIYSLMGKRVWIAGHNGMVGSALTRRLQREGCEVLTVNRDALDLTRQAEVEDWLLSTRPQAIIIAAAKVGGIIANDTLSAQFLYDNLAIASNIIHGAWKSQTEKLLFLAASCAYPRETPQPMTEDALLAGPLEPTNQWYAVAKIAGIKLCQAFRREYGCDFISAVPANLYGPGDDYHPEHSHVVAALIQRFHNAKVANLDEVVVWGTGKPVRDFMPVDECADALIYMLKHYSGENILNIGTGTGISIAEFAQEVAEVVGYQGQFRFDTSKPDGMPRKVVDTSHLSSMGWTAKTSLADGLTEAYKWFLTHQAQIGNPD